MPLRSVIFPKHRLVLTTGEGHLTTEEIKAHRERLVNDPEFDPTFNQLSDCTRLESTDLKSGTIRLFARNELFQPSSRRAFLVNNMPAHFGVARQFQIYHDERSIVQVFNDRKKALEWLGISEEILG